MKAKKFTLLVIAVLVVGAALFIYYRVKPNALVIVKTDNGPSTAVSVKFVSSTITASGSVVTQNQAKLNFQTAGKLTYLPFKEGDTIKTGQTIARLDTYQLQQQLTAALNNYRAARDAFDQTKQNSKDNVLKNQLTPDFSDINTDKGNAIDTAIKRLVDQGQASLDNSNVNVELANYAIQLSTLTSPLDGIVTHEDVSVSGLNITTATTFTVADPDTMVFRANVAMGNIYYITEGSTVSIAIDGLPDKINGTVIKIYPSKVILPSGDAVYQVDIASQDLIKQAKLDQSGTAIISTNSKNVALVPVWTVLGGQYIWTEENGIPNLKLVTVGKIHGNEIEITNGLTSDDKIIINPKYIPSLKYQML